MADNPMLGALEGLGWLGETLDTPRRALWKATIGKEYGKEITGEPISGFLLEALGDPLNLAMLGSAPLLKRAARGASLGYGTKMGELEKALEESSFLKGIQESPEAEKILAEIPPGSKYLGEGGEAVTMQAPDGHVIRIEEGSKGKPPPRRAELEHMLQANRERPVGTHKVEHVPHASEPTREELEGWDALNQSLGDEASKLGAKVYDLHPGNVGVVNGKLMAIDPGAIGVPKGKRGVANIFTYAPGPAYDQQTSRAMELLSQLLGYRNLERKRAATGKAGILPNRILAALLSNNAVAATTNRGRLNESILNPSWLE